MPPKIQRQIDERIRSLRSVLSSGDWPQDARPLRSEANAYRVGSGEYRILYRIDDSLQLVTVFRVRHRKEVYRNL